MTIQWFPGHMLETKKWLQQSAAKADVVLEILDARVPAASENPWMEKFSRHTPRVKILNKMDLADPEVTDQWLVYFEDHRRIPAIAVNATDRSMAISALEQAISLVPGNRARKKKSHGGRYSQYRKIHIAQHPGRQKGRQNRQCTSCHPTPAANQPEKQYRHI